MVITMITGYDPLPQEANRRKGHPAHKDNNNNSNSNGNNNDNDNDNNNDNDNDNNNL